MDKAFAALKQIPEYSLWGANSNTYAKQLLKLSGLTMPPAPTNAPGWNDGSYGGIYYDEYGKGTKALDDYYAERQRHHMNWLQFGN